MKTPTKETVIKLSSELVLDGFTIIDALMGVYGLYGLNAFNIPPRDYIEAKAELERRHPSKSNEGVAA